MFVISTAAHTQTAILGTKHHSKTACHPKCPSICQNDPQEQEQTTKSRHEKSRVPDLTGPKNPEASIFKRS